MQTLDVYELPLYDIPHPHSTLQESWDFILQFEFAVPGGIIFLLNPDDYYEDAVDSFEILVKLMNFCHVRRHQQFGKPFYEDGRYHL